MGVYHISQLLYLLGNPDVARITGTTYQKIDMDEARRQESHYDVEELGLGLVHFANGATLDIIEAWAIHLGGMEGSCIVGSKGGVRLEPFGFHHNAGDLQIDSTINYVNGAINGHVKSQQHWIAALQNQVELLPTAEIALNTMLISEGIYLSEKLGREVLADEVRQMSQSCAVKLSQ
jgi:predicted dehydrogenase